MAISNHTNGRVKGETALPTETLKLVKRVGVTRAHTMLGVSTTTLHKARRSGEVSRVVEIAAKGVLPTLQEGKKIETLASKPHDGDTVVVLLDVRRDKLAAVQKLAAALGAELIAAG